MSGSSAAVIATKLSSCLYSEEVIGGSHFGLKIQEAATTQSVYNTQEPAEKEGAEYWVTVDDRHLVTAQAEGIHTAAWLCHHLTSLQPFISIFCALLTYES